MPEWGRVGGKDRTEAGTVEGRHVPSARWDLAKGPFGRGGGHLGNVCLCSWRLDASMSLFVLCSILREAWVAMEDACSVWACSAEGKLRNRRWALIPRRRRALGISQCGNAAVGREAPTRPRAIFGSVRIDDGNLSR